MNQDEMKKRLSDMERRLEVLETVLFMAACLDTGSAGVVLPEAPGTPEPGRQLDFAF